MTRGNVRVVLLTAAVTVVGAATAAASVARDVAGSDRPGCETEASARGARLDPPQGIPAGTDSDGVSETQEEGAVERLNQEINRPGPNDPDEFDRRYQNLEMPGDRDSELDQLLEYE
jgi:hypothetical protein